MAEPTGAEAHEDEQQTTQEDQTTEEVPEDFDPERAMRTIRNQREEEKKLKERLRELEEAKAKLDEIEEAEAEAQRSLEEKLQAREARIEELEQRIAEDRVQTAFQRQAAERGYEDLELAYLAAKAQGVLGEYDPKSGTVGEADLDALEERHPSLAAQAEERQRFDMGDAGVRSRKPGQSVGEAFNQTIRGALAERL